MVDIFDNLSSVLGQQFQVADNKLRNLDIIRDGQTIPYGRLGQFADKFDQSAERSYTQEGMYRNDLFNPKISQLEIWTQEPDITILVKKRAFSSLAENYRTDLLSKDERLFLRATKFLFQNKCKQIAAYERLTKIESITSEIGRVDYHLLPAIFAATDTLNSAFEFLGSSAFNNFKSIVDRVKTIVNLSHDNTYTTWITNKSNSFQTDLGEGTGVIEFTTAFSISTTTSVNFGAGRFDIAFVDPHHLMRVNHNDIEQAIADATNATFGNSFVQLGLNTLNEGIQTDKDTLNKIRIRRGANPINFLVNADTFLGKRVRAIIDNSGIEIQFEGSVSAVDIDPAYVMQDAFSQGESLFGVSAIAGEDSLNKQEVQIFKRIVKALFNSMQLNKNSQTVARSHNAETNKLRQKLRSHYGTRLIIQPMDVVHIFVNSKTRVDNKILGGLQDSLNTLGLLQSTNKALMDLQDFFRADQGSSVEKSIFVGKDFPNWLWMMMRNQFIKDKSGTQIFSGIVENNNSNYDNNGVYSVNISGKDNVAYFGFGVVNYKPALDVWNGSLYDPITPFDIKFDRATGFQKDTVPTLLQENQELFKSAFVKYKNGVYVGKKPTVNNFIQDTERVQNASVRRVFYDPDGMVYKWKEGIGTLVMFGNNYQDSPSANASVPPQTVDPFAGQDIMNALSLLITGEPYNFATFYKAASQVDNFGRDLMTGSDPSTSYFRNLQSDIKKRNLLYGNFVPFKRLSMDTETYKNILNNQIRADGFDRELNDLLEQKADLKDRIAILTNFDNSSDVAIDTNNLEPQLAEIELKIAAKQQQIAQELNQDSKPISVIGDDVSLDYDPFFPELKDKNNLNNINKINKDLRRRLHFLTRRLSWKVRANEDVNLFIVDDSYDKDYDIQAFEKNFSNNLSLFRSDYITVDEQIKHIKELFDLEVFANTQGHIEIRPPQYNKMPSSVFYRMLRLKNEFDIQLFPQFIEDLYVNQIENVLSRLEVLEDEIRMYGLALAVNTDKDLESFISQTQAINSTPSSAAFNFVSDEMTGATSVLVLKDLSQTNNPDQAIQTFSDGLESLKSVKTQAKINNIFSVSSRANLLKQTANAFQAQKASINTILSNQATSTRQERITNRLLLKTGQKFDLNQLFPNSNKLLGRISEVDILKILGEISNRISERQKILKIASSALKNAEEGLSLIKNKGQIANKLLVPGLLNNSTNNPQIPSSLEFLIEDESFDDYGPGSGTRYVLKDHHIKSMTISENKPPFTAVEVQGKFGDNYNYNLPADLQGFRDQGGNALTTVFAVDYDLWRMYGIRLPQAISAPYLTNPETQCAPFAVALLNKARKQVKSGRITIIGNEYMQPGEVIYLEPEDTLFYVESVNHRMTYGREFSTSLEVGYGHMPGEYIPTYLDMVGKILYKNRDITNMVSVRDSSVNNEEHIGTIVGSLNSGELLSQGLAINSIMQGTFANENRQTLNSILETAENIFNTTGANYQPILELRIYYASQSGFVSGSNNAREIGNTIKSFLIGENNMFELAKTKQPEVWLKNFVNYINVVEIDSNDSEEFRSPSSQAYAMARKALKQKQTRSSTNTTALIDRIIYDYVVDCWIYFNKI